MLINLDNELKKSRQDNNRQEQISIQLQILDKIDQLDKQSIDQNLIQSLRQQLYEEEEQQQHSLVIFPSDEELQHTSQTQILPISAHISESSLTSIFERTKSESTLEQIPTSVSAQLLVPTSSKEQINVSLVTTDAKELYEELEKIRYSIEMAFEDTQIPSDTEDGKTSPVSEK